VFDMTALRLTAIILIFLGTTIAWMVLGGTLYARTEEADSKLRGEVAELWGTELRQTSPTITLLHELTEREIRDEVPPRPPVQVIPDSSEVQVKLNLDLRRKGLIWYHTYEVVFDAVYRVKNPDPDRRLITVKLFLPTSQAIYDDFHFELDGKEASPGGGSPPVAICSRHLDPNATATIRAHYKSRGMNTWRYGFGSDVLEARNFKMVVLTDFRRIDFPSRTLSPTDKREGANGWELTWDFKHLVSGLDMGVDMPEKLQPGPWAARLSFFAPVGLLFYIFMLVVVGVMSGRNLHPMHYFFVAGGFFAFHILLAYTVDLIDMHAAFSICSVVSVLLVVSYLMRVAGARFALAVAAPAQLAFLVLFSYAFYYPGYTGLTITVASIVTLALLMHLTARVDWTQKLGGTLAASDKHVGPPPTTPV